MGMHLCKCLFVSAATPWLSASLRNWDRETQDRNRIERKTFKVSPVLSLIEWWNPFSNFHYLCISLIQASEEFEE